MEALLPRKSALLFIVIVSTSLFSSSLAEIPRKLMRDPASRIVASTQEMPRAFFKRGEGRVIERILRVKTNDYGRYDAAPTLVKPPFKLIPN